MYDEYEILVQGEAGEFIQKGKKKLIHSIFRTNIPDNIQFLLFLIIKCQTVPKRYKLNLSTKLKEESNKVPLLNMMLISIIEKLQDQKMILMEFKINYQKQKLD